jgi:putative transposase
MTARFLKFLSKKLKYKSIFFYIFKYKKIFDWSMTKEERLAKNEKIRLNGKATRTRRSNQVCRVFEVKIDESSLSKRVKEHLKMLFVEAKWVQNDMIRWSNLSDDNKIWEYKLGSTVTKKNKDFEDETVSLKWLSSQMKQEVVNANIFAVRALAARKRNGGKIGILKFKKEVNSINLIQKNVTYKIKDSNHIQIQGIKGRIKVNGLKQFLNIEGIEFANAKLIQTPLGYYLKVTTFIDKDKIEKKIKNDNIIGVDFGCSTAFTTSEGEKIDCSFQESDRLKRLQRKRSKQVKGSKGRYKTNLLIRREYTKMSNRKRDFANKTAAYLYSNGTVVMQDEQLNKWKIGHGKKVQHSCLGLVKGILKRQSNCVVIDAFIPTTKFCTNCGSIIEMPLYKRIFKCRCGIKEDRDIHAAQNMVWMYNNIFKVGMGRTDLKRVEFLDYVATKFDYFYPNNKNLVDNFQETVKLEDSTL